jgi:hypothetical protein
MGVEPEDGFVSDDELKSLLDRWVVPGPSRVLDKRIETSFAREFSGADRLSQSVLLPRRDEVVSMKFCSVCQEEFADKFSLCPVDGTPLALVSPKQEDPSITVSKDQAPAIEIPFTQADETVDSELVYAAANTASALALRDEYHLTIMNDAGLVSRLVHELGDVRHEYELTWPEFKRDPFGFTKRTFVGYGSMVGKFLGQPNVLIAMGAAIVGMLGLVGAVMLLDRSQSTGASRAGLVVFAILAGGLLVALFSTWMGREKGAAVMGAEPSDSKSVVVAMVSSFLFLFVILGVILWADHRGNQQTAVAQVNEDLIVEQLLDIPDEQPTPDPGTAGLNKGSGGGSKPKPERPAGGGGGGREEAKPASFGKVPQASLAKSERYDRG